MEFKKLSAGANSYGRSDAKLNTEELKKQGITNVCFQDEHFDEHRNNPDHPNNANILKLIEILSICHTVIVEEKDGLISYNASSPDELALVSAARFFGYFFKGRDRKS